MADIVSSRWLLTSVKENAYMKVEEANDKSDLVSAEGSYACEPETCWSPERETVASIACSDFVVITKEKRRLVTFW